MSHGVPGVFRLYDQRGNPVQIRLQNGQYQLVTTDQATHEALDEIRVLLIELVQLLKSKVEP